MSLPKTCTTCAAPLPDDAPDGAICENCSAARESEQTHAAPDDIASRAPAYQLPSEKPRGLTAVGDFEIIDKLGQGGMGAVYRARQISLGRVVALKVLPTQFEADEDYVARFQREARVAASLSHANLVRVYASGQADGCHYIAMELVEGENLRQRLKRGGLSMAESLRICADVARGLQCGWDRAQLIHRDIKPSNVYLSAAGEVKLGDLGLAKSLTDLTSGLTQTGTAMGTALYMSPEQALGNKALDFRSDIYSLGCTLYELLTGRPPYHGSNNMTIMRQHIEAPQPAILKALPGCPMLLVRLVGRMLKKRPHERHTDYADLIAEMDWVREQIEQGATAPEVGMARRAVREEPATPPTEGRRDAPSLPGGKPNLPLYLALAAGVLVLGAAAYFLTRPAKPVGPPRRGGLATAATPTSDGQRGAPALPKTAPAAPTRAPYPTVAADGTVTYPVGVWTRLLSAADEAKVTARRDGEWMRTDRSHAGAGTARTFTNGGLRVRFRGQRIKDDSIPQLLLRGVAGSNLNLTTEQSGVKLNLRSFTPGAEAVVLTSAWLRNKVRNPSREFTMEFYAIGTTLIGRLDGETVTAQISGPVRAGNSLLYGGDNDFFRDAEFLNLDGLPEAEALRLAGAAPAAATIPADALTFGGRGYALVPGEFSWPQARAEAEARGGRLAIFETEAEEVGLRELLRDRLTGTLQFWIGGSAEAQSRDVRWLDGTLVGKLGWRGGNPGWREDPNNSAVREVGPLFAAGLYVTRIEPEDRWIVIYPRQYVQGFLMEWDTPGSAPANKDAPFVNSLGMKFVPVPVTGGPTAGQRVLFSVWETRVYDYRSFADETKRAWPKPDFSQGDSKHPAVNVSWDDAQAFCAWLTERERKAGKLGTNERYRLPSDHEWSCAVGIGEREDAARPPSEKSGRIRDVFPWGSTWPPPPGAGNYSGEEGADHGIQKVLSGYRDDFRASAPVGSFAANRFGLFDLGGNAREWCEDLWMPGDPSRVQRGAGFSNDGQAVLNSSFREHPPSDLRGVSVGFRPVLAPAP